MKLPWPQLDLGYRIRFRWFRERASKALLFLWSFIFYTPFIIARRDLGGFLMSSNKSVISSFSTSSDYMVMVWQVSTPKMFLDLCCTKQLRKSRFPALFLHWSSLTCLVTLEFSRLPLFHGYLLGKLSHLLFYWFNYIQS